ncbi:hypothetical protein O988_08405 [Pseudogymnoascus sp. VKM F-3808]|nr:hypothetical protein O988_08405 [Pseudogymnoascus sp. VKM F-3808]
MVAKLSILSTALAALSLFELGSAQSNYERKGQCAQQSSNYIIGFDIPQHVNCQFYSNHECTGSPIAETVTGQSNYPYASKSKYATSLQLASARCIQLHH